MTKVNIFLGFKDQAEEAFQLYSRVFNSPIERIIRVKDLPNGADFSRQAGDKIAWMSLTLGNIQLWGEDRGYFAQYGTEAADPKQVPRQFISVYMADEAEVDQTMTQLSQGGQVILPFAPNFFSSYYGRLVDRYGIGWELMVSKQIKED